MAHNLVLQGRHVSSLNPQFIGARYAIGLALLCKGELEEAQTPRGFELILRLPISTPTLVAHF